MGASGHDQTALGVGLAMLLGTRSPRKNSISHIDASLSRQPLVKGERLVRYEVNAVMLIWGGPFRAPCVKATTPLFQTWLRTISANHTIFAKPAHSQHQPRRFTTNIVKQWGCVLAYLGSIQAGMRAILAEGAMTLPVTLSGGVLFAS